MAKQERGIATRETILLAGARVFGRMHYETARVADILTEASITQGGFYFHFPGGKHQVAEELIQRQDAGFAQLRETAAASQIDGLSSLLALGRTLAENLQTDPVARAGIRLVIQASERFPEVAHLPHPSWLDAIESVLAQARTDGSLRDDVDIPDAARALVYLFTGAQMSSYVNDDWQKLPAAITATLSLVLNALATPAYLATDMQDRRTN